MWTLRLWRLSSVSKSIANGEKETALTEIYWLGHYHSVVAQYSLVSCSYSLESEKEKHFPSLTASRVKYSVIMVLLLTPKGVIVFFRIPWLRFDGRILQSLWRPCRNTLSASPFFRFIRTAMLTFSCSTLSGHTADISFQTNTER